jgi:capsular exopolysaccharide synthesis family protein
MLASMPVESLTRSTHIPSLSVITSGPGIAKVSSLLYSSRLDDLLNRLRSEFDVILIDVPPIFLVADARIIGRCADAAVLIIRAGRSSVQTALSAKQRLEEDGLELLGTVLNAWKGNSKTYKSSYYYYGDSGT